MEVIRKVILLLVVTVRNVHEFMLSVLNFLVVSGQKDGRNIG